MILAENAAGDALLEDPADGLALGLELGLELGLAEESLQQGHSFQ